MVRIAIIGSGAAGGAAALELARLGAHVTVIERAPFPRAKVCGEFVSPAATDCLERLLSPAELQAAGARRCRSLTVFPEAGDRRRPIEWALPAPAWVLSRRVLDDTLARKAKQAGARFHQPARVAAIDLPRPGEVDTPVRVRLSAGATIEANLVIHADGSGRLDASPHQPPRPTPNRRGVVGLKCHLGPGAPHSLRGLGMRCAHGAYVGTVGIEHAGGTVALVARTALVARYRDQTQHRTKNDAFDALLRDLWPAYDASWRDGAWLASGVAGARYRGAAHVRSFRIGNAAAAVEPVGGEGIGLALWSASTLARLLAPAINDAHSVPIAHHADAFDVALRRVHTQYARAYRGRLRWRLPACRSAAWCLEKPALMRTVWPMLASAPELTIKPWYALTGKPLAQRA